MTTQPQESTDAALVEVGAKIHALMWRKKISQGQLGAAIGVGQSTMSGKIRGRVAITVPELLTIAGVLGVDPRDLLPHLDSNQEPSGYASLQVGNVIPITRRPLLPGKPTRRKQILDTSPTHPARSGFNEWGGGRGGQSGLAVVE